MLITVKRLAGKCGSCGHKFEPGEAALLSINGVTVESVSYRTATVNTTEGRGELVCPPCAEKGLALIRKHW